MPRSRVSPGQDAAPKTLLDIVNYLLPRLALDSEGKARWDRLLEWPPDVFAVTGLLLEETGAYIWAATPKVRDALKKLRSPSGSEAPRSLTEQCLAWMRLALLNRAIVPPDQLAIVDHHLTTIRAQWQIVWVHLETEARKVRLAERDGAKEAPEITKIESVVVALLFLFTAADETANDLRSMRRYRSANSEEDVVRAYGLMALARLQVADNLSTLDSERVQVLSKLSTPKPGVTIRSISRYMALDFSEVEPKWTHIPSFGGWRKEETGRPHHRSINLLLLPWPLTCDVRWFSESPTTKSHFEYRPAAGHRYSLKSGDWSFQALFEYAVREAKARIPFLDGVVLPELALSEQEVKEAVAVCERERVPMLVAGVRGRTSPLGPGGRFPSSKALEEDERNGAGATPGVTDDSQGVNQVQTWIRVPGTWVRYKQDKQHRWFLDRDQIQRYGLGAQLPVWPGYWEDSRIPPRSLRFVRIRTGVTFCPLICEDLAREEPAGDLVRAVAPTLILALLLDGPQLSSRWPARHATVLAADPGSSVLTLTSYGLSRISEVGSESQASCAVALWRDPRRPGALEIKLGEGDIGILLTLSVDSEEGRTLDGRSDRGLTSVLTHVGHRGVPAPAVQGPPAAHSVQEPTRMSRERRHALESLAALVEVLVRTGARGEVAIKLIDFYIAEVSAVDPSQGKHLKDQDREKGWVGEVKNWFSKENNTAPPGGVAEGEAGIPKFLIKWAYWTARGAGFGEM